MTIFRRSIDAINHRPNLHCRCVDNGTARDSIGSDTGVEDPAPDGSRAESADPPSVRAIALTSACCRATCTVKVRSGVPSLRTVPLVREMERTFARACERAGFRLVPLLDPGQSRPPDRGGRRRGCARRGDEGDRLAARESREPHLRRSGPVLADRYHLHVLRTPRECGTRSRTCSRTRASTQRRPAARSRARSRSIPPVGAVVCQRGSGRSARQGRRLQAASR
jgi:hypothetical protein